MNDMKWVKKKETSIFTKRGKIMSKIQQDTNCCFEKFFKKSKFDTKQSNELAVSRNT